MTTDRLELLLKYHPFTRLNALLEGVPTGKAAARRLWAAAGAAAEAGA